VRTIGAIYSWKVLRNSGGFLRGRVSGEARRRALFALVEIVDLTRSLSSGSRPGRGGSDLAQTECPRNATRHCLGASRRIRTFAGVVAPADEVGGRYCQDCHVAEVESDATKRAGVKPYALNPETSQGAVGQKRGNGGRAVLSGGARAPGAPTCPSSLSSPAAPCRNRC
jgi:hypothetical protein